MIDFTRATAQTTGMAKRDRDESVLNADRYSSSTTSSFLLESGCGTALDLWNRQIAPPASRSAHYEYFGLDGERTTQECRGLPDPLHELVLEQFSNRLMRLQREHRNRAASDLVVDFFDDNFECGRFELCNRALERLFGHLELLSDTVLVAVLGVTTLVRERLPARATVVREAARLLGARHGEAEAMLILESLR
jgi:hypothetical protein